VVGKSAEGIKPGINQFNGRILGLNQIFLRQKIQKVDEANAGNDRYEQTNPNLQ